MASRISPKGLAGRRVFSVLSVVFVALAMAWGCASTQKGDGSESHFVNCSSDAGCAELGLGKCIAGKCERATPQTDGSVPSPDAAKADGAPKSCSPADPVPCVMECGHDGYVLGSCVNGVRTCPPSHPHPVDECPFVCGSGLYPPCCGTYGQEPRICPNPPEAICPAGTYETRGPCPDCAVVATKLPVPYPMTFRFTNASGKKVAVWHGCSYEFELTSCASGYTIPVTPYVWCFPICPDTQQVPCGACYNDPAPVSATTPIEQPWDGYVITNEDPAGDRACAERAAFGPTRYRIKVPVYADMPPMLPGGGYEKTPLYTVSVDFTTSPNGVVEIPIDQGPWGGVQAQCSLATDPLCQDAGCCPVIYSPYDPIRKCTLTPVGPLGCYKDTSGLSCTVDAGIGCQSRAAPDGGLEIIQTGSTYGATPGAQKVFSDLGFTECDPPLAGEVGGATACN